MFPFDDVIMCQFLAGSCDVFTQILSGGYTNTWVIVCLPYASEVMIN